MRRVLLLLRVAVLFVCCFCLLLTHAVLALCVRRLLQGGKLLYGMDKELAECVRRDA